VRFGAPKEVKQPPLGRMISGGICDFVILSQSSDSRSYATLVTRDASSIGELIIPLMLNRTYEIYSYPNLDDSDLTNSAKVSNSHLKNRNLSLKKTKFSNF